MSSRAIKTAVDATSHGQRRSFAWALSLCALGGAVLAGSSRAGSARADMPEELAFFEAKIRPVLVNECLKCHSAEKHKGALVLDHRDAVLRGGDSGPAVVPGKPAESLLLGAIRHEDFKMPPDRKLPDDVIADFTRWIERGAVDPRDGPPKAAAQDDDWNALFQARLKWWSLQPIAHPEPPAVQQASWPQNEVDRFILARLEAAGLAPAPPVGRRALARRLSFAIVGLPPATAEVEQFAADASPEATAKYVDRLLASEHFGERWARHWMDVLHYSDTNGYEWDIPTKNAWMFRDYLIRAFNQDVSYRQLVLEMLAGDLLPNPRLSPEGINESIHGPLALRLGERLHGDDGYTLFFGVTSKAFDNVIDTVTKGFLATTVACSQCHNHKLDAVSQRDYYALYGALLSSRFLVRSVDTVDPNQALLPELKNLKDGLRQSLAKAWLASCDALPAELRARKPGDQPPTIEASFDQGPLKPLEALAAACQRGETLDAAWGQLAGTLTRLRAERSAANQQRLRLVADFTTEEIPTGWQIEGLGLRSGLVRGGDMAVTDDGPNVTERLLLAGRWTHVWSTRLGGAVRSPIFSGSQPSQLAVGYAGGLGPSVATIVDNALTPEADRMAFVEQPAFGWQIRPTRLGDHRVFLELATKSYNNNFPPRIGFSVPSEGDPRSWFGVTRVYAAAEGQALAAPADELGRFEALVAGPPPQSLDEAADRFARWIRAAVERWQQGTCDDEDARLLNALVEAKLLSTSSAGSAELAAQLQAYRTLAAKVQPDRALGSIADMHEGGNECIHIRGSYFDHGEEVPRGNISLLEPGSPGYQGGDSGRLQLAESWTGPANPLAARVAVNRVWHYLFGAGLVRTVDDFGHLGETPSHAELLDYLATRYMAEGWSTKQLIRLLVLSATWQQSDAATALAKEKDPENRLWHCRPPRRLEAEAVRDSLLAVSSRLDARLYGPPIEPFRTVAAPEKRLFIGPLEGDGRRSIYLRMTLMEPPKFLTTFNLPLPRVTAGRRDVTNVPDQALALLNDAFVHAMARHWSKALVQQQAGSPTERLGGMFAAAFARPPTAEEAAFLEEYVARSSTLRGVAPADVLASVEVWQDVAHVLFNVKEFIYLP